jgi:hypothetical protein
MTSEEMYEYYGWMAYRHGFFNEWRNDVTKEIKQNIKEHEFSTKKAEISEMVFSKMLSIKNINQ